MKYALAIYGAPGNSQAPQSALHFARAVIARGHEIQRIFLYQDGVHIASSLTNHLRMKATCPNIGSSLLKNTILMQWYVLLRHFVAA